MIRCMTGTGHPPGIKVSLLASHAVRYFRCPRKQEGEFSLHMVIHNSVEGDCVLQLSHFRLLKLEYNAPSQHEMLPGGRCEVAAKAIILDRLTGG
jgi:hypothetical protein